MTECADLFVIRSRYPDESGNCPALFDGRWRNCYAFRDAVVEAARTGVSLIGADLRGCDLYSADLRGADLRDADLSGTDLNGTDLRGADLRGTVLDPCAPIPALTDEELVSAGFELQTIDGVEYVVGWRTARSQHIGLTEYFDQYSPYVAPWFSVDDSTPCHPGIYLAGLDWLDKYYPGAPRVRVRCLRSEICGAGRGEDRKYRCRRLWVIEEPKRLDRLPFRLYRLDKLPFDD